MADLDTNVYENALQNDLSGRKTDRYLSEQPKNREKPVSDAWHHCALDRQQIRRRSTRRTVQPHIYVRRVCDRQRNGRVRANSHGAS